ncbi:O-antigen polysaccharide polymerase Wzy family protein [Staphylococcus equorum]|uniref:O-antigen polysaccharide polymerase Wzy family protein n=1 Tax=Staphylococcus equorum TaxID=246432 RepID=UPI0025529251|nr:O-antigen polysaccharide polymerase Wzy family protein [Staphylococcus equorum]MDK9855705.1 O-antigen polysaccharide polymerase Wzy family protein [Staphylococcus equorum]
MRQKDKIILFFNFVFILFSVFLFILYLNDLVGYKIVTISLLLTVTMTIYILYKKKKGFLLVYLIYLFLTNFGIFITNVFIDNPFVEYQGDLSWYSVTSKSLFCVATTAILIYSIFSNILCLFSNPKKNVNVDIKKNGNKLFFYSGVLFIVGFTMQFLFYIVTGQLSLNTYSEYVNSIQELPMYTYGIFVFSIGIAFSFSNVTQKNIKYLILILMPQIIMFLATGNRGELFYPLLSALGVLIVRNYKIKWWMNLGMIFTLFFLIPFIKVFRNMDSSSLSSINLNWFSSLVEIGYTLRPLGYVLRWIDGGEELAHGGSYMAPIQNIFSKIIPGLQTVNYEMEGYGFRYRLPGMGFNVIAEAYYNGAIVGVIIVMMLLVLILWKFTTFKTFEMLSMGTAILSVLINNIRNAFSFVPAYILIILVITLVLLIVDRYFKKIAKAEKIDKKL